MKATSVWLLVWWPTIDNQIEDDVRKCVSCALVKDLPPHIPLHPWEWPCKPWQRVHADFAGPFKSHYLLIILDAHSKWPEIFDMVSTTTEATISKYREVFAHYGILQRLVTDNGPQFTSDAFKVFMARNNIRHSFSAPYRPATMVPRKTLLLP